MNSTSTSRPANTLYTTSGITSEGGGVDDLIGLSNYSAEDDDLSSRPTGRHGLSPELMISVMSIISLLALIGNAFVIFCFLRFRKKLKQNTVAYLISLAVSDLWIGVMTGMGLTSILYGKWVFGEFFCQFTGFLNNVALINSLWTVGLGSLDRCFAVSLPLRHRSIVTRKVLTMIVCSTWLYAMALSAPPLLGVNHYKYSRGNNWCAISSKENNSYFVVFFIGYLPIPMLTILTSYTIIFFMTRRYTKRQIKRINSQTQNTSASRAKLLAANSSRLTEDIRSSISSYDTLRQKTWSQSAANANPASPPGAGQGGGERESFYLHASRALQRLFSEPVINQDQADSPVHPGARDQDPLLFVQAAGTLQRNLSEPVRKKSLVTKITTSFVFSSSPNGTMKMFGNQKSQSLNRNISVSASIKSMEEKAARKLKSQAGTLLFVVTVTLLVSYSPMLVVANIVTFRPIKIPTKLIQCFILLMISNSAVNPFIYFLFNREFRSSAISMFKGGRRRANSNSSACSRTRANTLPSYITESGSAQNLSYTGTPRRSNAGCELLFEESPVLPHRPVKLKFSDDTDIPLERNNSLHIPPRASDSLLSTSRKYEGVIVKSSDKIENHTESISSREKRLSYRDKFNDSITNNMLINNIKELSKRMTFYEIESTL